MDSDPFEVKYFEKYFEILTAESCLLEWSTWVESQGYTRLISKRSRPARWTPPPPPPQPIHKEAIQVLVELTQNRAYPGGASTPFRGQTLDTGGEVNQSQQGTEGRPGDTPVDGAQAAANVCEAN